MSRSAHRRTPSVAVAQPRHGAQPLLADRLLRRPGNPEPRRSAGQACSCRPFVRYGRASFPGWKEGPSRRTVTGRFPFHPPTAHRTYLVPDRTIDDGLYTLRLAAAGDQAEVPLSVRQNVVRGGDAAHVLRGEFTVTGDGLHATIEVTCAPDRCRRTGGSRSFTLRMFGHATEQGFDVIGVGPLGLIVEMAGKRTGPLPDDDGTDVR